MSSKFSASQLIATSVRPLRPALILVAIQAGLITSCAVATEEDEATLQAESALSGQSDPGDDQVMVCPDANMGGNCQLMGLGLYPYSAGVGNDSMSSMKVGNNVRVTLCSDGQFGGTCQTFDRGRWLYNLGSEPIGNDRVSSVRVVSASTPDCRTGSANNRPPPGWAYLYRDAYFAGDCVAIAKGYYYNVLDTGMANDSISSALLPPSLGVTRGSANSGLILFQDQGYQNTRYLVTRGTPETYFGSFNDRASSITWL